MTSQGRGSGIEAVARYALSRADFDRAVAFYAAHRSAWGFELVNAPPSQSPGVLILSGASVGRVPVVAGDRLVSADRTPLGSLDAVTPELLAKVQVELNIVHQEQHTILMRSAKE